MAGIGYDPMGQDLMARTILGEAANQGPQGQAAVGWTVLNRLRDGRYGKGLEGVIKKDWAYEPWMTREDELMAISPDSPEYKSAYELSGQILRGEVEDPTNGATHFLNPELIQKRGDKLPSWYPAEGAGWTQIGEHYFGNPDGKRSRGTKNATSGMTPEETSARMSGLLAEDYEADAASMTAPDMSSEDVSAAIQGLLGDPNSGVSRGLKLMQSASEEEKPTQFLQPQMYRPKPQGRRRVRPQSLLGY